MSDTVEYIVKLKDEMSGTVNAVKHSTSAMNKEIEHSQSVVHELRSAFFEIFAAEKILEFFNGAREALEKYKFASAELDATLEANGNNIGFTRKELDALGDAARKHTLFTKEETIAMEGQLAMFHNIHGLILQEAIPAVLDLAAKMKSKPAEAAHALGLALDAPAKAARVLRQANITLSDAQEKQIKLWVETGQQAKAQQFILDTLTTSTKGAAAAAWEAADPLSRLSIRFEDTKIAVGGLIESLLEELEPAMQSVVGIIETSVKWIKENEKVLKIVAIGVAGAAAAWLIYESAVKAVTVAQTILNLVMEMNPIFMFVTTIGLAVAIIYQLYQQFEGFRKVLWATWEVIKGVGMALWDDMIMPFKIVYHLIAGITDLLMGDFAASGDHIKALGEAFVKQFNDVAEGIDNAKAAYGKSYSTVKAAGEGDEGKKDKKGLGIEPPSTDLATGASNVKETKPTIINITMGSLVNTFTVGVTNLTEGSAKVREEILNVMISAVSDSQVHAIGHT